MSDLNYLGRHYETGTIVNTLLAAGIHDPRSGKPFTEADVLGASGGIAFGYFVFEYDGYLPHVALLPRNTFDPFNRALDNLGVRRETRETTNEAKGEENLRRELDMGRPVLVWADMFSMPYLEEVQSDMWAMTPVLVTGFQNGNYQVVTSTEKSFPMNPEELNRARGRVKKDRYRIMVFESVNLDVGRLHQAVQDARALFLDKPPAGSANNFGATGMRFMAKMLTDQKNAKGWARKFEPGPKLVQALAGKFGQPGVWDWVTTWGTQDSADRATFAQFLRGLDPRYAEAASKFEESAGLWAQFAEAALPDGISNCKELKRLKLLNRVLWSTQGRGASAARQKIGANLKELETILADSKELADTTSQIQSNMAQLLLQIADIEEKAFGMLSK